MKSYRKELWFNVPARREFINITYQVEECLRESRIKEGLVLVNAMHITASVFINDDESGLHHDYDKWLEKLAPHEPISHYFPEIFKTSESCRYHNCLHINEPACAVLEAVDQGKISSSRYRSYLSLLDE